MPETLTPELELIKKELDETRELINLIQTERRALLNKRDRLDILFRSTPKNDTERKLLGILSRRYMNPYIGTRRESASSGQRVYDIHFKENENSIQLYQETGKQIYDMGLYVESIGVDFMYLNKR
jgi:hypothetical protein